MRSVFMAFGLLFCAQTALAGPIDNLNFYTENYPPYNMTRNGEPTGIAVDLLAAILERADTATTIADVRVAPWARGYATAKREPNTVLFATTRTEKREDMFTWVGPIASTKLGVIGHKDAPAVNGVGDLADAKTVTIRDDVAEQLLVKKGLSTDAIHSVASKDSIVNLLERGRVAYWAYETNVARYVLKQRGLAADYEVKHVLQEGELYYAFHPDSDPDAIAAFREAFRAVKDSPAYQTIRARYLE